MDSTRRGNYDSGQDYVLEYGELRFTFNERDFSERVEQAALKLGFVASRLEGVELEDLVNLTVNGEVADPASALGEHVNDCWPELVGPAERSLVHWLRRLVFRGAWLDQRVNEGELDVAVDADGFVGGELGGEEAEDLVNLVVNGEVSDPASGLGEHINDCWPELVGPSDRSLVHWLRRLVFRSAWLDQRVKEGELDVAFDVGRQTFSYVQPDRGDEPIELAPEPSWGRVAYTPR